MSVIKCIVVNDRSTKLVEDRLRALFEATGHEFVWINRASEEFDAVLLWPNQKNLEEVGSIVNNNPKPTTLIIDTMDIGQEEFNDWFTRLRNHVRPDLFDTIRLLDPVVGGPILETLVSEAA
jgi:hypothetical protein